MDKMQLKTTAERAVEIRRLAKTTGLAGDYALDCLDDIDLLLTRIAELESENKRLDKLNRKYSQSLLLLMIPQCEQVVIPEGTSDAKAIEIGDKLVDVLARLDKLERVVQSHLNHSRPLL